MDSPSPPVKYESEIVTLTNPPGSVEVKALSVITPTTVCPTIFVL